MPSLGFRHPHCEFHGFLQHGNGAMDSPSDNGTSTQNRNRRVSRLPKPNNLPYPNDISGVYRNLSGKLKWTTNYDYENT